MRIRRIDYSEACLVYDLFDQYRVFYRKNSDPFAAKVFIDSRLKCEESIVILADTEAGAPIGFAQLYPKYSSARLEKNWILNDLFVTEAYRKKGVGTQLIEAVFRFSKENGCRFVQLSTAVDNQIAQSLYETLGFEKQDPESGFYTYVRVL